MNSNVSSAENVQVNRRGDFWDYDVIIKKLSDKFLLFFSVFFNCLNTQMFVMLSSDSAVFTFIYFLNHFLYHLILYEVNFLNFIF